MILLEVLEWAMQTVLRNLHFFDEKTEQHIKGRS